MRYWHIPVILVAASLGHALVAQSLPDGLVRAWFAVAMGVTFFAAFVTASFIAMDGKLFKRVGDD